MSLPDRILTKMRPEDRKTLGKAGVTAEEAGQAYVAKRESELQKWIVQMLNREGIFAVQQRTDKRSNVKIGCPDILFSVRRSDGSGQAVAWEVKLPGKKPRPEQVEAMEAMARNGWRVAVIHSYDEARLELTIAKGARA